MFLLTNFRVRFLSPCRHLDFFKQLSIQIDEQILDFCRKPLIARAQDIYPAVADVSERPRKNLWQKEASSYCIKIPNPLFFLLLHPAVLEVIFIELNEFLDVHRVHQDLMFVSVAQKWGRRGERLRNKESGVCQGSV